MRKKIRSPFTSNRVSGSAVPVRSPKISVWPIWETPAARKASLLTGAVATASTSQARARSMATRIDSNAARPAAAWMRPHSIPSNP